MSGAAQAVAITSGGPHRGHSKVLVRRSIVRGSAFAGRWLVRWFDTKGSPVGRVLWLQQPQPYTSDATLWLIVLPHLGRAVQVRPFAFASPRAGCTRSKPVKPLSRTSHGLRLSAISVLCSCGLDWLSTGAGGRFQRSNGKPSLRSEVTTPERINHHEHLDPQDDRRPPDR